LFNLHYCGYDFSDSLSLQLDVVCQEQDCHCLAHYAGKPCLYCHVDPSHPDHDFPYPVSALAADCRTIQHTHPRCVVRPSQHKYPRVQECGNDDNGEMTVITGISDGKTAASRAKRGHHNVMMRAVVFLSVVSVWLV
jgi:hypothetical protein